MAPKIGIVLAVFRPDPSYLSAQIASISDQNHGDLSVLFVVADTISGPLIRDLATAAGLSYDIVTPPAPLDAVRAFELGLSTALERLPDVQFFALCDQDDIWHQNKLERALQALQSTGAELAHSDARVVDEHGKQLHKSLFRMENRQKKPGLRGLLYRNNVTGMTTLMTRRLVECALPFPPQDGVHFYHDLWLALVGSVLSQPAFVDRPLVDYRQHGGNAVGALGARVRSGPALGRYWLRNRATGYALAMYLARSLVLRFGQDPARLARLEPLKPFLGRLTIGPRFLCDGARFAAMGRGALSRIAVSYSVVAAGRSVWALKQALGAGIDAALGGFDQRIYALSPGQIPKIAAQPALHKKTLDWTHKIDVRTSARWHPCFTAEAPSLVILVPTLNPTEIFAGVVTALDFGLAVARRGIAVRFVATDLPIASAAASRAFILRRLPAGAHIAAPVSLHCGVTQTKLPSHRDDIFFATAWWTAHIAQSLVTSWKFTPRQFYYLIQDFEPNFYPWGAEFSGAAESYDFDFAPIFNSTPLRRYFSHQGFAFAGPDAMTFHPSIDIARYANLPSRRCARKLIALYGRPEVARNMFPLAIEALGRFLEIEKPQQSDVSLVSVGLRHSDIQMPGGHRLTSLGKLPWADYPDFLSTVDLGLSLMLSPHPSHPPLEMAAAGVNVVTNNFGPKNLSRLSPAIFSCAPTAAELTRGLRRAWLSPGPDADARNIDLTALGDTLDATADRLAASIRTSLRGQRMCA